MWIYKIIPLKIRNDIRRIIVETNDSSYVGDHIRENEYQILALQERIQNLQQTVELLEKQQNKNNLALQNLTKEQESNHDQINSKINQQQKDAESLQLKVGFLSNLQYKHAPALMPIGAKEISIIHQFCDAHGLSRGLSTAISKNDLMFHYSLLHEKEYNRTLWAYLSIGFNGLQIVKKIANTYLSERLSSFTLLDFASGHGRISRFLAHEFSPGNIWISDIKPDAVAFQCENFGVKGFVSGPSPMAIIQNQTFDMIFCGSLFSHLPELLFNQWLDALCKWLNPGGVLGFSVHDISLLGSDPHGTGFYFHAANEDLLFPEIEGHLNDENQYGIAYASEDFIHKSIASFPEILLEERIEKAFGGLQDVYVLRGRQA